FSVDDAPQAISEEEDHAGESSFTELESLRVPSFLSFVSTDALGKRKALIGGAVAFALIASVAVIGVPAGWYHRSKAVVASSEVNTTPAPQASSPAVSEPAPADSVSTDQNNEAALAAKRQHEKEKAKLREEKAAALLSKVPGTSVPAAPVSAASDTIKPGPKKVAVTVSYDES